MFTRRYLDGCVERLGGGPGEDAFEALRTAYTEPGRQYHTAHHVNACLRLLAAYRHLAERPDEVAVALCFHDAVYDTRRSDNEARSAEWATRWLAARGAHAAVTERVRRLVLATRHDARPIGADEALLVDLDLSVLGRSARTFARYDAGIRREYAWVPAAEYARSRAEVLRGFLARDRIFVTAPLFDRFEARARANLRAAMARLAAHPDV